MKLLTCIQTDFTIQPSHFEQNVHQKVKFDSFSVIQHIGLNESCSLIKIQFSLAKPVSDDSDIRPIWMALVQKLQQILLCSLHTRLLSAKSFLLEEGLLVLCYFSSEDKQQLEDVFSTKTCSLVHIFFGLFRLVQNFTGSGRFSQVRISQITIAILIVDLKLVSLLKTNKNYLQYFPQWIQLRNTRQVQLNGICTLSIALRCFTPHIWRLRRNHFLTIFSSFLASYTVLCVTRLYNPWML